MFGHVQCVQEAHCKPLSMNAAVEVAAGSVFRLSPGLLLVILLKLGLKHGLSSPDPGVDVMTVKDRPSKGGSIGRYGFRSTSGHMQVVDSAGCRPDLDQRSA